MLKIFFILLLIIFDFFSKKMVSIFIDYNNFILVTSFFDLAHIHNYGISFGLFSSFKSHWIFVFIGLIIIFLLIFMYFKSKNNIEKWAFLVIIGGGLSNIVDRAINGYVIDFLYFHYQDFDWPAFNFADIYITIGVFMVIFKLTMDFKKKI